MMLRKSTVFLLLAVALVSLSCQASAADIRLKRVLKGAGSETCGSLPIMAEQAKLGPMPTVAPVLIGESNVNLATSSGYQAIRIGVFSNDLDNSAKYCTQAGDVRPNFTGLTLSCTSDDVLTTEKKNTLLNQLIPAAIKMHEDRLKVVQEGAFRVPTFTSGACAQFAIPTEHQTSGVSGYDFVLYVAAGPTSGNTIAWATTCASSTSTGRPVVGVTNISPKYVNTDEKTVRVVVHEIAHALGFNYNEFQSRGMTKDVSGVRGKPSVPELVSTNVVKAGKEHFGWSGLTGVELEDQGGSGTAYSHWKRRNLKNELMAGISSVGYYTSLTLAAFEDLGYYQVNYDLAETMPWSYNSGSKLLTEKCVIDGKSQYPSMFCDDPSQDDACSADRLGIGACGIGQYSSDLPSYFQYFSNPVIGGTADLMDYCPIITEYSNAGCADGEQASMPGSLLSSSSRCFSAVSSVVTSGYSVKALCASVKCDKSTATYQVKVSGASSYVSCKEGSTIVLSTQSSTFSSGSITCPSYMSVCNALNNAQADDDDDDKNAAVPSALASPVRLLFASVAAIGVVAALV